MACNLTITVPDATAVVKDTQGNILSTTSIPSGVSQDIIVEANTMINVLKGDFTGEFDLSVQDQNGFYNDYESATIINSLSIAANPTLGAFSTVRIIGGSLAADAIPDAWNGLEGDAISQDPAFYNVLMILYVASNDIRIVNTVKVAPDITAPLLLSATVENATDNILDFVFNEAVTITTEGWSIATDGAALSILNVASGSGTTTPKFTLSRSILGVETLTISYDSSIGNTVDGVGNELSDIVNSTITNNTSIAFTTFNGTTNYLRVGNVLNSLFSSVDTYFELEIELDNIAVGPNRLMSKFNISTGSGFNFFLNSSNQPTFVFSTNSSNTRTVSSSTVITNGILTVKYDGSLDTNNGLDRVIFELDGSPLPKSLLSVGGTLPSFIPDNDRFLGFGDILNSLGINDGNVMYDGDARNFIIRSSGGTIQLNIPDLSDGTDISGNSFNGTFV